MTAAAIKIVEQLQELEGHPHFLHTLQSLHWWIVRELGQRPHRLAEAGHPSRCVPEARDIPGDISHPAGMPGKYGILTERGGGS